MSFYFIYITPEEESLTYTSDQTVMYTIHFKKLDLSLLDFFHNLWKCGTEGECEAYVTETLGCRIPAGLWNIYGPENQDILPKTEFTTNSELFAFLKQHLVLERYSVFGENTILAGTNMEFDHEYAFFEAEGFKNKELGKWLQPLVESDSNGELRPVSETIRLSAYL